MKTCPPYISAEDLLARIREERQKHYEQQLAEWSEAVAEWEANASSAEAGRRRGKEGRPPSPLGAETKATVPKGFGGQRKPAKPNKPKEYALLMGKELEGVPELPEGWKWVRIDHLANVIGGLTKNSKRPKYPIQLPYLRVANVYAN